MTSRVRLDRRCGIDFTWLGLVGKRIKARLSGDITLRVQVPKGDGIRSQHHFR